MAPNSEAGRGTLPQAAPLPALPLPPATWLMTQNDIVPWLSYMAGAFPEQMRMQAITVTAQGRQLLAVEISPQNVPLNQLRRLAVICRQHGDEPETTAAGVAFIHQFLTGRSERAFRRRQQVALLVVPVANLDGASRKRRHNDMGQDLNRDWGRGRTPEVNALMGVVNRWKPHLVVDVHQWVPGDASQTPMAEASGQRLARLAASRMTQAVRANGGQLNFRVQGGSSDLCHRYLESISVPSILLETRHRPGSVAMRTRSIRTTVTALQQTVDLLVR